MLITKCLWICLPLWSIWIVLFAIISSLPSTEYECILTKLENESFACDCTGNYKFNLQATCQDELVPIYSMERTYCECCSLYCKLTSISSESLNRYPIIGSKTKYETGSTYIFLKSNGIFYLTALKNPGINIMLGFLLLMAFGLMLVLCFLRIQVYK